jgi:electron transfer flavoprotein alpha subunit
MSSLVIGEIEEGRASGLTLQIATFARHASGGRVSAAFLAGTAGTPAADGPLPFDRVYELADPQFADRANSSFEPEADAVAALCRDVQADIIVFGKTDFGVNVGARVAWRLGAPLAQDCTGVDRAADGTVTVTRPVYGGNAEADFASSAGARLVVTVRAGAFAPASPGGAPPERVRPDLKGAVKAPRVRVVQTIRQAQSGVRLEDADVIVSGGRGLGGPEPFEQLGELAGVLGGSVGASRAACDAGWIGHDHQVGLTGKTVSPKVYIAIGISGASQHMAGCSGAGTIIAINKDREANIFKEARYGVVGDWRKVLPAFMSTVRDLGKG